MTIGDKLTKSFNADFAIKVNSLSNKPYSQLIDRINSTVKLHNETLVDIKNGVVYVGKRV